MLTKRFIQCIGIGLVSCSAHKEPDKQSDTLYFPIETGRYSDFRVEKTQYEIGKTDQYSQFRYRRTTGDPFTQADGSEAFSIHYSSQKQASIWKTDSVTASWQTTDRLFELENGQPAIKITFPLYNGASWNANTFNSAAAEICKVEKVNQPHQIENQFFPKTVTIVRQDDSTLLSRKKYIEVYAQNVGLIRRERLSLRYCYSADCVGKGIILSGSKEITTIENFGIQ